MAIRLGPNSSVVPGLDFVESMGLVSRNFMACLGVSEAAKATLLEA